jgi:tryptophanyl-tRNA synthetase
MSYKTAAMLIAVGVDPDEATLFLQSHVGAQHAQLAWILECIATFGELSRMTQFKDKSGGASDGVSVGLFAYPVLQAADVLLYDADHVPVGADQKQHLELVRNLAQRFNNRYGADELVVPAPLIAPVGARIMDLQDPTSKMSTSGGSEKGTVWLLDEPDVIRKKFRSAVTDSENEVRYDPAAKPGVSNLLELLHITSGESIDALEQQFADAGYGTLKQAVGDAVVSYLEPIQARFAQLIDDRAGLDEILASGAQRAREQAERRLARVRDLVGLVPAMQPVQ